MGDRLTERGRGASRVIRILCAAAVLGSASFCWAGVAPSSAAKVAIAGHGPCRVGLIEGEVAAGQVFERPIGNGLRVFLEPLASGWLLRVLPAEGPRGRHDYAELATPPYQSVSPLLVSTDFSFRAQDALAWNPRHFHYAADRKTFVELQQLYDEYQVSTKDASAHRTVEVKLAGLAAQTPEGELTILDAHLVQGTADQARTAAMVASHLKQSAHQVDQSTDATATPLGRINSLRFRLRLYLPMDFRAGRALAVEHAPCP